MYPRRLTMRPACRSVSNPARARPGPPLWRPPFGFTGPLGRLATATIVLVLAIAVVLSVPATRAAVADLFGFAGVNVRTAPSAAPSPRTTLDAALDLGEPVTLDEARQRVSFPVSLPAVPGLDAPDAVYVRDEPGLESVSLVYQPTTSSRPPLTRTSACSSASMPARPRRTSTSSSRQASR